jgi:hypothetical protein
MSWDWTLFLYIFVGLLCLVAWRLVLRTLFKWVSGNYTPGEQSPISTFFGLIALATAIIIAFFLIDL